MVHTGTATPSARPRGTVPATSQAGRLAVLPIFLVGIATPCAVWATGWFIENVVFPGSSGDWPNDAFVAIVVIAPIELVVGGIVAAALPSRAPAWQRLVGLSAGLALSLALIAVVMARLQDPVVWTYYHDPGALAALALSHWADMLPYVGVPALAGFGLTLLARLVVHRADDRARAIAARAEAHARREAADSAPVRFWDGSRWVERAGATDGSSGRGR